MTPTLPQFRRRALLGAIAALAVIPAGRRVAAQATVAAEVMVILASEAPGTIAPELADLPMLRQPPFSGFPTMRLLATHPISLVLATPVEVPLPNGRVLTVEVEERGEDGRYRTRVGIPDHLPSFEVRARPCEPFFLAGQSFGGGRLVLGVRIGAGCP